MSRHFVYASVCSVLVLLVLMTACSKDNGQGPNTPPTASFTVQPSSGTTQTVFQFDASASSDDEDPKAPLEVRWDWDNDGTWDTGWSTTKTANHQYNSAGAKTINLEVKDTGGLTGDTTGIVAVSGGNMPIEMVLVPAGSLMMGDGSSYCGTTQHQVALTHSFYLGTCEVTNKEYRDALQWAYEHGRVTVTTAAVNDSLDGSTVELMHLGGHNVISFSEGTFLVAPAMDSFPVIDVSWYGAAAYCDWMSMQAELRRAYSHRDWECGRGNPYAAVGYRLPTEAEWEYAARYSDGRIYPWGSDAPTCAKANYGGCVGFTSKVRGYPTAPASLGLYDMAGNVWEWCNDWWQCDLGTLPVTDPRGPSSGSCRVLRGGSWVDGGDNLRCAFRLLVQPSFSYSYYGFRCARSQ